MISLISNSSELDIVAISAHPDDAEIGCGGILAKLAKQGYNVGIIDLTDGEPTPFTVNKEERFEEATKSGVKLGLRVREIVDLPNRKLFDSFEARLLLAQRLRMYKPKILLSQYGMTPHDSPDHYQAQLITEGAIFYTRLSKWDEYFSGLPVHRIKSLFYFVTLRENPNPDISGMSKIVLDITNHFETKKQALLSYQSQFRADPNNPGVIPWIETMARYFGRSIDKEFGEPLFSPKSIEVPNLDFWLGIQL
jgi:LmbE family N-acetylglucosaminyl deacetylase